MSFINPIPCGPAGGCCPHYLSGFCLADGTPISIVIEEEVQTGWINLETGVFTIGPPPIGTGACPTDPITVTATDFDIRDFSFATDAVDVSGSFVTIDVADAVISSAPAQTITGAAAIVLAANAARRSFTVQNTGLVPVYITLGAVNPTGTAYHFALSAGLAADDGKGSLYSDDQWVGEVRAFSSAPGSIVVMEIS